MAFEVKPHLQYQLLDDESEKEETDNFPSQRTDSADGDPRSWYKPQRLSIRNMVILIPWTLSSFLAVVCLVLSSKLQHISNGLGTYETGFRPDMSKCYHIDCLPYRPASLANSVIKR